MLLLQKNKKAILYICVLSVHCVVGLVVALEVGSFKYNVVTFIGYEIGIARVVPYVNLNEKVKIRNLFVGFVLKRNDSVFA